jgi:hypothetical protein
MNPVTAVVGAGVIALTVMCTVQSVRVYRLKVDVAEATRQRDTARASLKDSEGQRAAENKAALDSYAELSTTCATGMAASLKKGRLIERIVNAPAPATGPRGLIGADSLRDIVGQGEPESLPY